jgi:predicted Zn finger-like uncharacterized protein
MPEITSCPSCQRKLKVPDNLLGQSVKCPSCGMTFKAVPAPLEVPPPAPPPEPAFQPVESEPPASRYGSGRPPPPFQEAPGDHHWPPPRPPHQQPGKVQAIAIMTLIGGILATLWGALLMLTCYGLLWPGTYFTLVMGIMAIVQGSALLGRDAHRQAPPKAVAVMQIINIINCDVPNCLMGILSLVFQNDPEVQQYFRG